MSRLLVAVDCGPSTAAVVGVAQAAGDLFAAELDVVTVRQDPSAPGIRRLEGNPVAALTEASAAADVVAVVTGIRALPGGGHPAGHVTQHVIQRCPCPVVTVPPDLAPGRRSLSRLVAPIEGTQTPSTELRNLVRRIDSSGRTLVGLHVFDRRTTPACHDHWGDAAMWADEFWRRNAPMIGEVHVGAGDVAPQILEVAARYGADGIVMEWSQSLRHGHAQVVKGILGHTTVPVILLRARPRSRHTSLWVTGEPAAATAAGGAPPLSVAPLAVQAVSPTDWPVTVL